MPTPQSSADPTLQIRRTFAAPREKVFAAWTRREQLEKWMCRDVPAHTVMHHEADALPGGRYLMEVRDSGNGGTYWGQGVYREVAPPEKLVFTWAWTQDKPDGTSLHPAIPRRWLPWNSSHAETVPKRCSRTPCSAALRSVREPTRAGTAASTCSKKHCNRPWPRLSLPGDSRAPTLINAPNWLPPGWFF
jgi:uncharacterized protein YndB with AHSA1/START domain